MNRMTKVWMTGFLVIVFVALMFSFSSGAEKAKVLSPPVLDKGLQPKLPCSDLVATLSVTKSLSGENGIITLSGQICNGGPGDYKGKDSLDAYFMVYTWHPPKTPAQEGDLKFFGHTSSGSALKNGECKTVRQSYTIPGVIHWGFDTMTPTKPGQRQAIKQFVLAVEKKYPMQAGDVSFSKCEDSNLENSRGVVNVEYMEKGQTP